MKIDFHTHGKLAKKLPFSKEYTDWLLREARNSGLDAICLTEHFNTLGFHEIYRHIIEEYPQEGDCFLAKDIRIFAGMEIDIRERGHILVIGKPLDILALNQELEAHKTREQFLTFREVLAKCRHYDVLMGGAHPFREGSAITKLDAALLRQLDFVDLNGKDMAESPYKNRENIDAFAKEHQLAILAGSDTHQSLQYGCISNLFDKECSTIKELKEEISAGRYRIETSQSLDCQVRFAGILKRSLKEIHSLGGDYVSILTQKVQ